MDSCRIQLPNTNPTGIRCPPAMVDTTLSLLGLSPVCSKPLDVRFDGGVLSSDGGLLLFREVEERLRLADRLAGCLIDPRNQAQVDHTLTEIIRFRMLAIVAGYEDGNDCNTLRHDPIFKIALGRLPERGADLCSQSTVSRLENLPSRTDLYRMARALVDQYCASCPQVPDRIVLDLDDTFDATHGAQQPQLFNAHYDEHGFQPIVIFDAGGRLVTAVLRPAKRPSGREILTLLDRIVGRIRTNWPAVRITLRGDSHYACPEVMDWAESEGHRDIFGLAGTKPLHRDEYRHRPGQEPVRADLLRPRPDGEPHQILQAASGGRPLFVRQGDGQPVPPVPACRGVLAALGAPGDPAKAVALAHCPIRHDPPAPDQDR